jgi:hypothetical protein
MERLMTSEIGNHVTNRLGVANFLQVVKKQLGRICNRWDVVSVYWLRPLSFPVTKSGKDRFRPFPVTWEVRNHVQSIFVQNFLEVLYRIFHVTSAVFEFTKCRNLEGFRGK